MTKSVQGLTPALGRLIAREAPENLDGQDGQVVQVAKSDGTFELLHKADGQWWSPGGKQVIIEPAGEIQSLDTPVTIYVGPGSADDEFPTLGSALRFFAQFVPGAGATSLLWAAVGTVVIRSGYGLAEQIVIKGVDLAWVTITRENDDDETEVDVTGFVNNNHSAGGNVGAFIAVEGCSAPAIDTMFVRTGTPTSGATTYGLSCANGSFLIHRYESTDPDTNPIGFKGFDINLRSSQSGGQLFGAVLDDAGTYGYAQTGGSVIMLGSKMRGADLGGARIAARGDLTLASYNVGGSEVQCNFRSTDGVNASTDLSIDETASVYARHNFLGGCNLPFNTPGIDGALYDTVGPLTWGGFLKPQQYANVAALPSASLHAGKIAQWDDGGLPRPVISDGAVWRGLPTTLSPDGEAPLYTLNENLLWTVGPGGDYPTLSAAFEAAQAYVPIGGDSEYLIEIKILSGVTLTETVYLVNPRLAHVIITSENNPQLWDVTGLTIPDGEYFSSCITVAGGHSPKVRCYLEGTGTNADAYFILRLADGAVYADTTDVLGQFTDPEALTEADIAGMTYFVGGLKGGSFAAISVNGGSFATLTALDLDSDASMTISHGGASQMMVSYSRIRNSNGRSILTSNAGNCRIYRSDFRATAGVDGASDLENRGALVDISQLSLGGAKNGSMVGNLEGLTLDGRASARDLQVYGFIRPADFASAGSLPSASLHPNRIVQITGEDTPDVRISHNGSWISIVRPPSLTVAEATTLGAAALAGVTFYCPDGAAGSPCFVRSDGSTFYRTAALTSGISAS
jgi:hypothetical protein